MWKWSKNIIERMLLTLYDNQNFHTLEYLDIDNESMRIHGYSLNHKIYQMYIDLKKTHPNKVWRGK